MAGAALLAVAAMPGCHRDGRVSVSGTVTIDDQPAVHGLVNFRPAEGNPGNSAGATLRDGQFEIPAKMGLLPGSYVVNFRAFRKTGRMVTDGQAGLIPEWASVDFEQAKPLEVTVVSGKARNRFEFQLTSSKGNGVTP